MTSLSSGPVPSSFWELGCIVNLAGNSALEHGPDVSIEERSALISLFNSTNGPRWTCSTGTISLSLLSLLCLRSLSGAGWTNESLPVAKWYKVGVLGSRVHSIVMSSNNMVGSLPPAISKLTHLRMIELATMPGLSPHSRLGLTSFSFAQGWLDHCQRRFVLSPRYEDFVSVVAE
jgi:hypothetical protein